MVPASGHRLELAVRELAFFPAGLRGRRDHQEDGVGRLPDYLNPDLRGKLGAELLLQGPLSGRRADCCLKASSSRLRWTILCSIAARSPPAASDMVTSNFPEPPYKASSSSKNEGNISQGPHLTRGALRFTDTLRGFDPPSGAARRGHYRASRHRAEPFGRDRLRLQ